MNTKILVAAAAVILLAGCSHRPQLSALPIPEGPPPEVTDLSLERPLACVGGYMANKKTRRDRSMGVLDVMDKTGAENKVGNDSFGTFMSQASSDMLISALGSMSVTVIELSPSYRAIVDWLGNRPGASRVVQTTNKKEVLPEGAGEVVSLDQHQPLSMVRSPDIGIVGAVSSFNIIPGGGAAVGVAGVSASYNKNGALASVDLRAVEMPRKGRPGGKEIAHVTVKKQILQEGFGLTLDRYFTIASKPRLVNFEIGAQLREPIHEANRAMINLAAAELVAQVLRYEGCLANQPELVVAKY